MSRDDSLPPGSVDSTQSHVDGLDGVLSRMASSEIEQIASSTPPSSVEPTPSLADDDTRSFSATTRDVQIAQRIRHPSGSFQAEDASLTARDSKSSVGQTRFSSEAGKQLMERASGSKSRAATQRHARKPVANINGAGFGSLDGWLYSLPRRPHGEASKQSKPSEVSEAPSAFNPDISDIKDKSTRIDNEEKYLHAACKPSTTSPVSTLPVSTSFAHSKSIQRAPKSKRLPAMTKESTTMRRSQRGRVVCQPAENKSSKVLHSLQIDMFDISQQELRDRQTRISTSDAVQKKRKWRGWAVVDDNGNEIVPSDDEDDDEQTQHAKRRKVMEQTADSQISAAGDDSAVAPTRPIDSRYHKSMEQKGKFYSGQPMEDVFPLPHNFYLAKLGPEDTLFKPKDIAKTYKLSAEVFNPLNEVFARDIKDWHVTRGNKNTFVGEAKHTWIKSDLATLPESVCICSANDPCDDETCWNRSMGYECNEANCTLGAGKCKNRPFADLAKRIEKTEVVNNRQRSLEKSRAEKEGRRPNFHSVLMSFDQGVEVSKAGGKGFGVRAQRSFEPGQIIMEYFGEIIDEEEKLTRMMTVYKDSTDFYMMEFVNGFTLDATKGSMARFVNHSCNPNCEIRQMQVRSGEGKKASVEPRMALFAVDYIKFGDELTYDYNFKNFNEENKQKCLCGAPNCRGYLGPKPAKDRSKEKKQSNAKTIKTKGVSER